MFARLSAMLRRIAFLCRKEALAIVKDPANRVILIAPVVVQSLLFGYGATYDLNHVPYALLDQSRGAGAVELAARIDGSGVFQRVATLRTPADIARVIDAGQALLVVHLAADFDRRLTAGQDAPMQVVLDGRNSTTAGMAAGHLGALVTGYNATLPGAGAPPVRVSTRAWFNPNLETRWNIMPGLIATLSMIQTLMLAALSVAREREQGTFDQLLVTPLNPLEILVGKALPAILIGLVQSTLILLVARYWFAIPLAGSPATLYLGLLLFTTASVGIGLSISALSANMQQAMVYTFVLMMPLILLSGLVTPVGNMPEALRIATWANPLRFAVDLVRRVYLEGAGLRDVAIDFLPMLAVAAVTLPLAAWLFRNRLV
ncbi:ABC transporter permease [Bordetella bronchiseptica]|uniref:ABC transporter permease n=1 Tax=Bordetella bronchiseptica TaxID=518 RepID=UPI00081CEA67|nr:ABC transporter permease [Bordetella bronchiseptica]AOB27230.1 antibiotic ABC transporter permease [Bordetella bronchiseptica]AZW44539.1 ABC transporter permease [Bordetella bronchiseptica]